MGYILLNPEYLKHIRKLEENRKQRNIPSEDNKGMPNIFSEAKDLIKEKGLPSIFSETKDLVIDTYKEAFKTTKDAVIDFYGLYDDETSNSEKAEKAIDNNKYFNAESSSGEYETVTITEIPTVTETVGSSVEENQTESTTETPASSAEEYETVTITEIPTVTETVESSAQEYLTEPVEEYETVTITEMSTVTEVVGE